MTLRSDKDEKVFNCFSLDGLVSLCRLYFPEKEKRGRVGRSAAKKLDHEDYQGAIADCSKAIKLKPDFAEAYYGRGGGSFV